MIELASLKLLYPWVLWFIPGAALLLLILITRNFVSLPLTEDERRSQRRKRVWIFVSRVLIITLVVLALAQPYQEEARETKGNPRVTVLVDQSASSALMDMEFVDQLIDDLDGRIPTTKRVIGSNLTSDVGSAVLRNLEPGGNLLLISDGNVNEGPILDDVAFYAATINVSVSAINLSELNRDAAVVVSGPGKVVADSDATYVVKVSTTDPDDTVNLEVHVDNAKVLDKPVGPGTITFTQQFNEGVHKIEAIITTSDAKAENNVYYKAVHVLEKPKVLFVSKKNSPVELLLRELYTVEKRGSLPADLDPYYAVIANDVPVESMARTQELHDYLIDEDGEYYGNGLVFFGGMDSFDRGGYSGSALESLLPVKVGKGERKKGGANLVFVLDMSGTTGGRKGFSSKAQYEQHITAGKDVFYSTEEFGETWINAYYYEEGTTASDVIKAQAVEAIEQLKLENKVGVIAFGLIPGGSDYASTDELIADSVKIIEPLDNLYNNRKEIVEKIPRITPGGPTSPDLALRGAVEMLAGVGGDKHIILLTTGRYSAGLGAMSPLKQQLLTIASNARKQYGVNFMSIGVGVTEDALFPKKVDEVFMKEFAAAGDGTYDRATKLHTLLIKWGDPKAKEYGQEFTLVPMSLTHFITRDIEPSAILNAYSEVAPKDTAEFLLAADSGQPALTTWRYGNGRVATWTVYAGNNLGQLLNDENSLLVSRTINWAIGDPQRKEAYFVDIQDVRTNRQGTVTVQSDSTVTAEGLTFSKEGNRYRASFEPDEPGFGTLLGHTYATNRPTELDSVGLNPGLGAVVAATGGKVFKPSDDEAIVEHAKEVSRRVTLQKEVLILPFLAAAMLIFLIEIAVRRITQRREG